MAAEFQKLIGSAGRVQPNMAVNVTTTTATNLIAAPGANLRIVITNILVTNSNTSTGTRVRLQDNAGTPIVYASGYAAPESGWAYNGLPLVMPLNTRLDYKLDTALTTNGVDILVRGYIERVNSASD